MNNQFSVISCEFSNNLLVQKSYVEDFNNKSQLIVYESQEALFYKNGQALDLFGPGRHNLSTENVPLFKRFFGALFGGKTPCPCDVYFVNRVNVLDIMWGTDTPIIVEDPKYHLIVNVRGNGQLGIHVKDSRRFVVKVVGQLREFTVETVRRSIKGMLLSTIKELVAQTIIEEGVSVLEITAKLGTLSERIQYKLNSRIDDLGLEVDHFAISTLLGDDADLAKLRKVKERRMDSQYSSEDEAYRMTVISEARAKARAMEGYTYQDERRFDVLQSAAENQSTAGGFVNLGVGIGMGTSVGREFGNMMNTPAQPAPAPAPANQGRVCPTCGTVSPKDAKFCSGCGAAFETKTMAFCPNCGAKTSGMRFCSECGFKLEG